MTGKQELAYLVAVCVGTSIQEVNEVSVFHVVGRLPDWVVFGHVFKSLMVVFDDLLECFLVVFDRIVSPAEPFQS